MSDIRLSKDMIGNKVRCVNKIDIHYPEQGTIGTIIAYDEHDAICNYKVQWPKGSTVGNDRWWAINKCIELAKDDVTTSQKTTDMTNEEIWEMLQPKMQKNGLSAYMFSIPTLENIEGDIKWVKEQTYKANDVHNAIALAYKVGYLRAMKGRPFKFGEKKAKKQGGHWEPVDPDNLPKEGTKVRYSRECSVYGKDIVKIGDTGVVVWEGMFTPMWFGIRPDSPRSYLTWIDFGNGAESCLDMWVEDDE